MWPHSITIGVRGKAIAVGTDAPEMIAKLEPWRISDVSEPFDYCLELHPEGPGGGNPRPLPGLYHGSIALLRSRDTARLTTALLRVLGSHARPAVDGQVRLRLVPVVREGVAFLAPPVTVAAVPDRWMLSQGFEVMHTGSSLVDTEQGRVLVDPPLGMNEEPRPPEFGGWWLPPQYWEVDLSPGFAVAQAMPLVVDVTAGNATAMLRAVAALVERAHPAFAPASAEAIKDGLTAVLQKVVPG